MKYLNVFFLLLLFSCTISAQPDYTAWDNFLKKYVSSAGDVDYAAIKNNKDELNKIVAVFEKNHPDKSWSKNEQLTFWINAYNLFTIKLIIDNYPLKSIQNLDGGKPWDVKRIRIGSKKYSLNNIENDIIRPEFKDARIHFAVNCAAKSCPPLLNAAYKASILDSQLDSQTKKFVNNSKFQTITRASMTLSKIFDWYGVDFGNKVDFLNRYSKTKISKNAKILFKEYDWSLNDIKK